MKKSMPSIFLLMQSLNVFGAADSDLSARNWLILGASHWNTRELDKTFGSSNVIWTGFDQMCDQSSEKCIQGDFNKIESLDRLKDNHYDVIYFDHATIKFMKWTLEHLQTIAKKLKDPGLLLIPTGGSGLLIFLDPNKSPEKFFKDLPHIASRINDPNIFLNGNFGASLSSPYRLIPTEAKKLIEPYENYITEKALIALQRVFPVSKLIDGEEEKGYPPVSKENFRMPLFYAALKTTDDTLTVEKAYEKLVEKMISPK